MAAEPELPLWELIQTAHVVERLFIQVFADAGLTPTQFGVLASLADGDDLSQAELARAILVRPQSIGRLLRSMVDRGLIIRDGPPGRGRRSGYTMTADGQSALDRALPAVMSINTPEAVGLSSAQSAALVRLLRAVRSRLDS